MKKARKTISRQRPGKAQPSAVCGQSKAHHTYYDEQENDDFFGVSSLYIEIESVLSVKYAENDEYR
ncbi:MAG TPA: hypothetical protein VGF67_18765 [Ktedonobacteraceae bacterium]|jgi:hypothetical protein